MSLLFLRIKNWQLRPGGIFNSRDKRIILDSVDTSISDISKCGRCRVYCCDTLQTDVCDYYRDKFQGLKLDHPTDDEIATLLWNE